MSWVRAAAAAVAMLVTAPVHAALIQFDFTTAGGFTNSQYYNGVTGEGLSATGGALTTRFIFDTQAMTNATIQLATNEQTYVENASGGPAFLEASAVSPQGYPVPTGLTGHLYAIGDFGGGLQLGFQADFGPTSGQTVYEYHENGALAREFTEQGYIAVGMASGDPLSADLIDGFLIPNNLDAFAGNMAVYWTVRDLRWDDSGTLLSQTDFYTVHSGAVTGAAVTNLSGPTPVPAPAALSLFALGLIGLGLRRRSDA